MPALTLPAKKQRVSIEASHVLPTTWINRGIKVHFLFSRLDQIHDSPGNHGDEQSEKFYQDLKVMEDRCKGRWDINMLADYCWTIERDEPLKIYLKVSKMT